MCSALFSKWVPYTLILKSLLRWILLSAPVYKGKRHREVINSLWVPAPCASSGCGTDSKVVSDPLPRGKAVTPQNIRADNQSQSCQKDPSIEEPDSGFTEQNVVNVPWKEKKKRPIKEKLYRTCAELVLQKNGSLSGGHRFKKGWNSEKQR